MDPFAQIIEAAIASLRANLPGRLADHNATQTPLLETPPDNGGPLGDPGVSYLFGGLPQYPSSMYPVVDVATPDATLSRLDQPQIRGDLDEQLVVACRALAPGEEFPTLYRRALAYAWALTDVLLEPKACGEVVVSRARFAWAGAGRGDTLEERRAMRTVEMTAIVFLDLETTAART